MGAVVSLAGWLLVTGYSPPAVVSLSRF